MRGSMARLAGITMALAVLCAAPASARVLQPAATAARGRRLRLRAREPGRLLDQRRQARLPDVERERGWRHLLRDGRIDGGLHRPDRAAAGLVERQLPARLCARLPDHRRRHLHDHGQRAGRGPVAQLRDRRRLGGLRRRDRKRAHLLPGRAGRAGLHPLAAAHGAGAPERRERDDVSDAEGGRRRHLPGQPEAAGYPRQRRRRLVGRRRLPQVRADRELHDRRAAERPARLPGADGAAQRGRLHGRDHVRGALAAADVERPHEDALLPGGSGRGQRPDHRRPRHLAAAAGRRHLGRAQQGRPLHPPSAGVPGRQAGLADQPQPGRARRRGLRGVLPGVQEHRPGAGGSLPALGRGHLRAGGHPPQRPPADGDPVRLLPGVGVARRPRVGRHGAVPGHQGRTPAAGAAARAPALLPEAGGALGACVHQRPERRGRHAQPV